MVPGPDPLGSTGVRLRLSSVPVQVCIWGVPASITIAAGVVLADRRARLHRVSDETLVDEFDAGHVGRSLEGSIDRALVAEIGDARAADRDVSAARCKL